MHSLPRDRGGPFQVGDRVLRWASEGSLGLLVSRTVGGLGDPRSCHGEPGRRRDLGRDAFGGLGWDGDTGVGWGDDCHLVQGREEVAWSSGYGDGGKYVGLKRDGPW